MTYYPFPQLSSMHSKSYTRVCIHVVWGVKYRAPLLHKPLREDLFDFIRKKSYDLNYGLVVIGGVEDHVHCLFNPRPTQNISRIVKDIKGSSSRWINEHELVEGTFEWQVGYGAFSVSSSMVRLVVRYILGQERHHGRRR